MQSHIITEAGQNLHNDFMKKLQAKAEDALKGVFLDMLTPDQYKEFAAEAADSFFNGAPSKRYKYVQESMFVNSIEELPEGVTLMRPYTGPSHYNVQVRRIDEKYDRTLDPDTLPGMLRQMLKDQVKKETIQEIMNAPEMKQKFVQSGQSGSYSLFEGMVTKFLQENMELIIRAERQATVQMAVQSVLSQMHRSSSF